jgi:DNA-binding CsgD family transcriptional regulator
MDDHARAENSSLLTPRERAVLQLAADGLTTRLIAEHLSVSEATVRTHVANARLKLHVSNRAAAVAKAIRSGLIS